MPRLRRVDPNRPGITRKRRGRSFSYHWQLDGSAVTDADTLERIKGLVIPPAWQDVWISPWPNGHIQAVGTDAAGRRQYRYHDDWRRRRDAEKFARALQFGQALPSIRRTVLADLRRCELDRRRVLAAAVRLIDIGCFRIGGEVYAKQHETFGIATLRREHVTLCSAGTGDLTFEYPAKGSIPRSLTVCDPVVSQVLSTLKRRRGGSGHLLAWQGPDGWVDVRSSDINDYLKAVSGGHFSAKDFRTWSGTVNAAMLLALVDPIPKSATGRRRSVTAVVKQVAEHLGNTPAVCRSSYIDPRVIDHFDAGTTIAAVGWPGRVRASDAAGRLRAAERAVLAMLAPGGVESPVRVA